jgi:ribosomal protein S8
LVQRGFSPEAVEFAERESMMTYDHLIAAGYMASAANLVKEVREQIRLRQTNVVQDPKQAGKSETNAGDDSALAAKKEAVKEEVLSALTEVYLGLWSETSHIPLDKENDAQVARHQFSYTALKAYAGPRAMRTANHVEREGVTVHATGLEISNQPITLPSPEYADVDGLDSEGIVTQANRASRRLWLGLKYHDSMPVLSKLKLISKPTKRIWLSSADLSRVIRGQEAGEVKGMRQIGEVMVVSTDKGIMEARDCVERRIGGQPLMRVW